MCFFVVIFTTYLDIDGVYFWNSYIFLDNSISCIPQCIVLLLCLLHGTLKKSLMIWKRQIFRPASYRCDAMEGIRPARTKWVQSSGPEETFTEMPKRVQPLCKKRPCLFTCAPTRVCVSSCQKDLLQVNHSLKIARRLNTSWKVQTCQSAQRGFMASIQFLLLSVCEIKWFQKDITEWLHLKSI